MPLTLLFAQVQDQQLEQVQKQVQMRESIIRFHSFVRSDGVVIAGDYNVYAKTSMSGVTHKMRKKRHTMVLDTANVKLAYRCDHGDWLLWVKEDTLISDLFLSSRTAAFDAHYANKIRLAMYVAKACNCEKVVCIPQANDPFNSEVAMIKCNPSWDSTKPSLIIATSWT